METVDIPLDRVVKILCKYGYVTRDAPSDGRVADVFLGEGRFALSYEHNFSPETKSEILSSDEYHALRRGQYKLEYVGGIADLFYVDPTKSHFLVLYTKKMTSYGDYLNLILFPKSAHIEAVSYSPEEFLKLMFHDEAPKPPSNNKKSRKKLPATRLKDWRVLWGTPGLAPAPSG